MVFDDIDHEFSQFSLANIPFGVVSKKGDPTPRIATRYWDHVYLIPDLIANGFLAVPDDVTKTALSQTSLNAFATLGRETHREIRSGLQHCFRKAKASQDGNLSSCAIKWNEVISHLPVHVGDFSDFSCSKDHVLNASEAVTGVRQLPPGFLHFPIGYGGRSSSILPPESPIRRPLGQFRTPDGIEFGPSRAVDFELELACVIGKPSTFGEPVNIGSAADHIFGFLLLNDWSARDIQGLEMNPLGPFNGKSFGTSISPWIITADALEPFRVAAPQKEISPVSYLQDPNPKPHYAIELSAEIEAEGERTTVCRSRVEYLYWSISDMIAHQTINGCPLNAGDILATGTVSGGAADSHGCLLEITKGGKQAVSVQKVGTRTYLHDGDAVRLTGWAGVRATNECVGFGECYGQLLPNVQIGRK